MFFYTPLQRYAIYTFKNFLFYFFLITICIIPLTADSTSGVSEVDCKNINSNLKGTGTGEVFVTIENNTSDSLSLYWLNKGKQTLYATIQPNVTITQQTYAGHFWVLQKDDVCQIAFMAKSKTGNITIGKKVDYFTLPRTTKVVTIPEGFGFHEFYKKYINTSGIPILSPGETPDRALEKAAEVVAAMTKDIPAAKKALIQYKIKVVIMSESQELLDIPEYVGMQEDFPDTNWNVRARGGMGPNLKRPVTSAREGNLLCYKSDPYLGESILVHEFGHAVMLGLILSDPKFESRIESAYQNSLKKKLWENTYAAETTAEYWAEGVQDWFDTNLTSIPSNGVHNHIHTREQIKKQDPVLSGILQSVFGDNTWRFKCD
jgi:hypothetical protein